MVAIVGFQQPDKWMVLVLVRVERLIDVIDEQPVAWEFLVVQLSLPILDLEVLLTGRTVLPQPMHLLCRLYVTNGDDTIFRGVDDRHPALVDLAPGRWMRRRVAASVPAAAAHQAPIAKAFARSIRVVQVRPAEEQV